MAEIKGGEKLQTYLAGLVNSVSRAGAVKVGFLAGATYPDGTPVAAIAAIQNFGAPKVGIPPRPFFTNMVKDESPEWGPKLAKILPAVRYDGPEALRQMGEEIAGALRQSIVDTNSPPLKPATIARKGFEKPLVDTGQMLNSVDYEVT